MRKIAQAIVGVAAVLAGIGFAVAQVDPNPAMNNPDKEAWTLFFLVNANSATAGNNNAMFETWASDGDTFQPTPVWPTTPSPVATGPRALSLVLAKAHTGLHVQVVPGGTDLVSEETRRNKPDFDFIVQNKLFKVSGLAAAFASGKPIVFRVDSIEVKANWVDVTRLHEFNGFTGSPADAAKAYHLNSVGGKTYALVAFHIISKLVPNWTWATFEHKDNPGRCDVIGCNDNFGAQQTYTTPLSQTESQTHYPDCVKSPALQALFASSHIDPSFANYCLKGSQSDFTDVSGLSVRVGNSVTENGFVAQASCMSCHGRAAFDSNGHATTFAGFDPIGVNLPLTSNTGSAPVGPLKPQWFWSAPTSIPPSFTGVVGETDVQRVAFPSDFVWSVPFCAIDDTASPPQTKSRFCSRK